MTGTSLLLPLALALSVVFAAFLMLARGLRERELSRSMARALRGEDQPSSSVSLVRAAVGLIRQVGTFVQRFSIFSPKDVAELERAARSAGYSPEAAVPILIGGKLLLMIAGPLVAYVVSRQMAPSYTIISVCVGVVVGMFGPNMAIGYARGQRLRSLRLGLTDALDLLVVCAEAGLGLETAIDRVAVEMRHSNRNVAQEFSTLSQDLRLSADRGAALMRMGERTGLDSFQRLTMTLSQTLRYGTPLGHALRILAVEMRNDRMMRLEEKAAKLPTLMMIPLALFILPCLFIVVGGPAILRVMSMMH